MPRVRFVVAACLLAACSAEHRPVVEPDSRVAQVLILPDTLTIDPLGLWQFDVLGRTDLGDSVPVDVLWSASAGTITPNALFTADSSEDDVTVTATLKNSPLAAPPRGLAVVRKRKVEQILLLPDVVAVLPGATQQFSARGVRSNGDTIDMGVNFSATGGTINSNGVYTAGTVPGTYRVIGTRRALADTSSVTILPAPVASLTLSPGSASLYVGATAQLTATARDAWGNELIGRVVAWSSDAPTIASVTGQGVVSAAGVGSTTITATSEGTTGTATISVALVPVASVSVSPATATLRTGTSLQLNATARDSAGHALSGRTITGTSSAPAVATVSSGGLVTALAPGSATITASSEGKSGTATVTVALVPVASVGVTPGSATLRIGTTVQLNATARDSAGNVLTGRSVTWTSSAAGIATVSAGGIVSAIGVGSATITATSEGKTAGAAITVAVVPVAAVVVSPALVDLRIGATAQLAVTTLDSAGTVLTGRTVTWMSSAPGIATVSASGIVTAIAVGAATITASSEGKSGTASAAVTLVPVASVTVTPDSATLRIGTTVQFNAATRDSARNAISGRSVAWTSSAPAVASVNASGIVSAIAAGSAKIIATSEGISGTASLTVTAVPVVAVTVSPATANLRVGSLVQLSATARDSAGNALSDRTVAWSSSAPGIATVSSGGLVTGISPGSVAIAATSEGKSDTATITVTPVPVASVSVEPTTLSLRVGGTAQLSATSLDSVGNVLPGRTVTWASDAQAIATVSAAGAVSGVTPGSASIMAMSEGKTGTAAVTVTAVPVTSVTVSPGAADVFIGGTVQLNAVPKDSAGNPLPGREVSWSSAAAEVATVTGTGLVTGIAAGSATIIAASEGGTGSAAITVKVVPVASVTVTPPAVQLRVGTTLQLTAEAKDSSGTVLPGRVITWASGAPAIATVSSSGLVSAVSAGQTTVTATVEGKTRSAGISVTAPPPPVVRAGHYVDPGGDSRGDGTADRPWDLATALSGAAGRVLPGDTVWLRAGVYRGAFTSTVAGVADRPVVVRAYPGERAVIDGAPSTSETLTIEGDWSMFWGFEMTNSNLNRNSRRPQAIWVRGGSHVKLVNLVVHDVGMGLYTEPSAQDLEVYGSIFYNEGWQTTTRSDGHGVYLKNAGPGTKVVRDNVFFNSYGLGIHAYTDAGDGQLRNLVIEGNVAFNSGTLSTFSSSNLLLGGEAPVENSVVRNNVVYFSPGKGSMNLRLGYLSLTNTSVAATDNYIVGGTQPLDVGFWRSATVSGNTIVASGKVLTLRDSLAPAYAWAGQSYYRDSTAEAWGFQGSTYSFNGWRAATGLGLTDLTTIGTPSTTQVFVRPNAYEPGRATVIVANWSGQSAISVPLGGGIPAGTRYEVRSVQDLFGPPLWAGVFDGAVTIPLGAVTPSAPIGGSHVVPSITGPAFDVFVVIPVP